MPVRQPRVNDMRIDPATRVWQRFSSAILPAWHTSRRGWPDMLFPYQVDGVRALLVREAILLADDTGLGKNCRSNRRATHPSAATANASRIDRHASRALLRQWRTALANWAPELFVSTVYGPPAERAWQWQTPAHIYLVSYDTLREEPVNDTGRDALRRT